MIESDVSIYLMMRPRAWVIIGLLSILCCGIISRDETIQLAKVPRDAELGLSTTNVTAIVISGDAHRLGRFRQQWPPGVSLEVMKGTSFEDLGAFHSIFSWRWRAYEWWQSHTKSDGSLGDALVTAAHYKVLKDIAARDSGWFAVFEDDAVLHHMNLTRLVESLPPDATVVNLYPGGIGNNESNYSSNHLGLSVPCRQPSGFHGFETFACDGLVGCICGGMVGYLVSPRSAHHLLQVIFPISEPIDLAVWTNLAGRILPGGISIPPAPGVYLSTVDLVQHGSYDSLKWRTTFSHPCTASLIPSVPDSFFAVFALLLCMLGCLATCRTSNKKLAR